MDEGTEQAGSSRRLLWVAGAAKEFGISTPGVKRLIRSGALPTIEMGEAVRIPLAAIDRLVQAEAHKGEEGTSGGSSTRWPRWTNCVPGRRSRSERSSASARMSPGSSSSYDRRAGVTAATHRPMRSSARSRISKP
jgi:excisionase family DNA binding protein